MRANFAHCGVQLRLRVRILRRRLLVCRRVGGPAAGLFAAASYSSPIRLACGEKDNVTDIDGLRSMDPNAIVFKGLSHNAHVEDPATVWKMVQNLEANII